jgi:hypothetical protein
MYGSAEITGDINNLLHLVIPKSGNYREGVSKATHPLSLQEKR